MRHLMRFSYVALIASVFAFGCGDSSGADPDGGPTTDGGAPPATFEEACRLVPGCQAPAMELGGAREGLWRVLVTRDGSGAVTIEAVEEVEVVADVGPPEGPLAGTHGLAALDGSGNMMEFQYLRFPEVLFMEGIDIFEEPVEEDLSTAEVSTVGYLRVSADVSTLAIVDSEGTIVVQQDAPAPGEAVTPPSDGSSGALVQASPATACAHIMIIEGVEDEIWYPRALRESMPLRELGPLQHAVLQAAVGMMPPMLCAAVSRITFVDMNPGTAGKVTAHAGDLVLLNENADYDGLGFDEVSLQAPGQRARLMHTLFHEAGHTAEWLLNEAANVEGFVGDWVPSQRSVAEDTIDRARMRGGFGPKWERVHNNFQNLGWAGFHLVWPLEEGQREVIRGLDPAGIARRGMMSMYGTKNMHDDIAEFVAWPMSAELNREAGIPNGPAPLVSDYGCVAMRAHMERSIPQALSVVYTKLAFVRDLGLITPEVFDRCTGPNIGLPVDQEGITVYQDNELQRIFSVNPTGVIGTLDDRYVFELTVSGTAEFGGETYDTDLRLVIDLGSTTSTGGQPVPLEHISWPRGVYPITIASPHRFELRMADAPAANFNTTEGFVLVTEATNDRIVGSVVVQETWRPDAPIPVPESYDPPLQFRFLLEN